MRGHFNPETSHEAAERVREFAAGHCGLILQALIDHGLTGCGSNNSGSSDLVQIRPLSNRADLVSGRDAFVRAFLPDPRVSGLKLDVDGRDVTSAFPMRSDGRMKGVITGLANGNNVVTAAVPGSPAGRLAVNNHPIGGPVISGTQIQPWVYATPVAVAESGSTPATNFSGLSGPRRIVVGTVGNFSSGGRRHLIVQATSVFFERFKGRLDHVGVYATPK